MLSIADLMDGNTLEAFAPGVTPHERFNEAFVALGPLAYRKYATSHELTVKNRREAFHARFKLWLATETVDGFSIMQIMQRVPGSIRDVRRLIITHAGVPTRFRRKGVFTHVMQRLVERLHPEQIEIEAVTSDEMRAWCVTHGFAPVPGHEPMGGSYRKRVSTVDPTPVVAAPPDVLGEPF
jgi:hypothetical protein